MGSLRAISLDDLLQRFLPLASLLRVDILLDRIVIDIRFHIFLCTQNSRRIVRHQHPTGLATALLALRNEFPESDEGRNRDFQNSDP